MGYDSKKFGTLEKYILNLVKKARLENFDIIIIYNQEPKSKEFLNLLKENNVIVYFSNALSVIEFWKTFYEITKKYKPVLVHSHFQPLLPSFYGWLLGYKYRWNTMRLMLVNKNIQEVNSRNELKVSSRIYRLIINMFTNKYFCVSKAVFNQYAKVYPNKSKQLACLYNGVELFDYNRIQARENLKFEDSIVYICCIAFASNLKGLDILIRAYKEFLKKNIKIETKLCLIGLSETSPITQQILNLIEEFDISDNIINFGIINNVPQVLPAMDIYIQPSRSESLSNAIIEAGLFEIPAIGSNVGGIPEVIVDNKTGFLFPMGDYTALSEKIYFLVENKIKRTEMGVESRNHKLENFSMESKVNELLGYYKMVNNAQ